jgi:membrane protease YdiL (CAAX protease family)
MSMTISRPAARRGLLVYLATVAVLSTPIEFGIIATDALAEIGTSVLWLTGLMLVPTVGSVVARLAQREGFADLRFRRGRNVGPALALAAGLPFAVGAVAYGVAWITGLVGVQTPPLGQWAAIFGFMLALNLVLSTGEELGWRGYMLPRMVQAGVPAPLLVSSLVWGLWHVPLFLWGDFVHEGPAPVIATALLLGTTTALGYILGRLRLDTGNVWPAVVLHIVWNTVIQIGFDFVSTGAGRALWIGETGIFTVTVLAAVALAYRAARPAPGLPSDPGSSAGARPQPAGLSTH